MIHRVEDKGLLHHFMPSIFQLCVMFIQRYLNVVNFAAKSVVALCLAQSILSVMAVDTLRQTRRCAILEIFFFTIHLFYIVWRTGRGIYEILTIVWAGGTQTYVHRM